MQVFYQQFAAFITKGCILEIITFCDTLSVIHEYYLTKKKTKPKKLLKSTKPNFKMFRLGLKARGRISYYLITKWFLEFQNKLPS